MTEERFYLLSDEYEAEQKVLKEQLVENRKALASMTERTDSVSKFIAVIEKYKSLEALDEVTVIELIDKIVVHECEYVDNERIQKVDIYYNFIGLD